VSGKRRKLDSSEKIRIRQICLCKGCVTQATYKVTLEENLLTSARFHNFWLVLIGFSSRTMIHDMGMSK